LFIESLCVGYILYLYDVHVCVRTYNIHTYLWRAGQARGPWENSARPTAWLLINRCVAHSVAIGHIWQHEHIYRGSLW